MIKGEFLYLHRPDFRSKFILHRPDWSCIFRPTSLNIKERYALFVYRPVIRCTPFPQANGHNFLRQYAHKTSTADQGI